MKICILSAVNIKHMSLITLYTELFKKNNLSFDIIYMDKYDEDEYFECTNKYRYINVIDQNLSKYKKAIKYMSFLQYATKILNKEKYDFIIVWNDVAIFMFADYLAKKYKGKYCLNVRDNMMYDKKIFNSRYKKVFMNAAFSTTSSMGFTEFLPAGIEYIPIHSLNLSILDGMNVHTSLRKENEPIRIGFIGYVRFFDINKKMLDVFKNDDRFELHYYGKNADHLKKYAESNGIINTVFHDSFPMEQTKEFMEKIDVMNNLYGNNTVNLRKAISIKFFHALYAHIPILVCENTYVGEIAKSIGVGFMVKEINMDMKESLYLWYENLNYETISNNCSNYLLKSVKENKEFESTVYNIIREI